MGTIELTLGIIAIVLAVILALVAAFFLGYVRGSRERRIEPVLPDVVIGAEQEMHERGYLDISTQPMRMGATTSIEIVAISAGELEEEHSLIDRLTAQVAELKLQVARQSRLRARYLRLLKAERAMTMNNYFTRHQQYMTPYWHGWVRRRSLIVDRLWAEASQGSEGIASTA